MKILKAKERPSKIVMKTKPSDGSMDASLLAEWWKAEDERQLAVELCGNLAYLKTNQTYRMRQLAVDIRLYCGLSVYSYAGSNVSKMDRTKSLPDDRPTFNLIQACTDTLVSRLTQNEPAPKFLTDGADYKQRHLAQELNRFILGEYYQTDAYVKAAKALRDCITMGTGVLKVYRGDNDKVCIDRVLCTDLFVDDNDSLNGDPQTLIQMKLVDRDKLFANNPDSKDIISQTPQSYPDNSDGSGKTIADQVLVAEGWKLPSGPDPKAPGYIPGRHTLATMAGVIHDEVWDKETFPFVFMKYSDPFLGFWGQGLATQLFGTQLSINRIMYTISRAISLVGVPRVFIEQSSKVVKAHNNNEIGVLVTYSGTKPSYEIAPCNAPELYEERDRLIEYGFRQCGVSAMQATSQKPAGLNSGEAIRSYDDINTDRFAQLSKKYENLFVDMAYLVTDCAMDIAKDTGKYQTVYPNKDGTKEIDLPKMGFLKDPFVIKCFTESALPHQPAGRIATLSEWLQAGAIDLKEFRRMARLPDLEQNEKLVNASEERIFKILDDIVEDGKYTMPDPFIDFELATVLVVQYINLYFAANLEDKKRDLLEKFFNQIQAFKQAAITPPMPGPMPMPGPEAAPPPPMPNAAPQAA